MNYLRLIKKLKSLGFIGQDWGMDRIFVTTKKIYTFTYRDHPASNANDIIHLMVKTNAI